MSKKTKIAIGVVVLAVIGIVVGILVTRPKGDFTITPATSSLSVPITKAGTLDITLAPPQGKTLPAGDITFSIKETLPAGVKATFNPAKITVKAGDDQKKTQKTTLTVEITSAARTGNYTLTVVAKGGGVTRESKLALTVQAAPDYTLEVSPATLTVNQGATGTVTVNIKRTETMKDEVELAVTGAPTGVTATVEPAKVPADKTSATLKIEVGPTVEVNDYTLTITGKAPGIADKTATLTLKVQRVDFTLKAEPSVVTLQPGESAQVKITITRTNLTAPVQCVVKNKPDKLSVAVEPASATGNEVAVTISAAPDIAPGDYSFTVEGTAAGKTRAATINVKIGG